MDLEVRIPKIPCRDVNLLGTEVKTFPGGQRFNQVIGAGQLEIVVVLIGELGNEALSCENQEIIVSVGTDNNHNYPQYATKIGLIQVNDHGQNSIASIRCKLPFDNRIIINNKSQG